MEMLEERVWMGFNSLIEVTKNLFGWNSLLMFPNILTNMCEVNMFIDYRPFVSNALLNLKPLNMCIIQNRRSIKMTEEMCVIKKNDFCQP